MTQAERSAWVSVTALDDLCVVNGVRLGVAAAGIKRADRHDLLLIELVEGASVAGVFTRNAFCAAPVTIARKHLAHAPRWMLVNSGNANAGTGQRGYADAMVSCEQLAQLTSGRPEQVLPFSTGVIGEYLPMQRLLAGLPEAVASLDEANWALAARAIMTTDTCPKAMSVCLPMPDGHSITLTGIAKGSGMIHPDMATMLAYIATDARIAPGLLQNLLVDATEGSFNSITVDGDTSTNDACMLMATGVSPSAEITADSAHYPLFRAGLEQVCQHLAESIVRDGEGATKFMAIEVAGALSRDEARGVGFTIAHSPLVKTAFFASDPNWGRILAAVGRAGCVNLDLAKVSIWLGDVRIVAGGERAPEYTEAAGQAVMAQPDIVVRVELGRGDADARVLTCDFSYDYVRINAEYRT